jgi:hypothetical protein
MLLARLLEQTVDGDFSKGVLRLYGVRVGLSQRNLELALYMSNALTILWLFIVPPSLVLPKVLEPLG